MVRGDDAVPEVQKARSEARAAVAVFYKELAAAWVEADTQGAAHGHSHGGAACGGHGHAHEEHGHAHEDHGHSHGGGGGHSHGGEACSGHGHGSGGSGCTVA